MQAADYLQDSQTAAAVSQSLLLAMLGPQIFPWRPPSELERARAAWVRPSAL